MPHQQFSIHHDTQPFAVIDIGSNSVRLVVYHDRARVPVPVFNEKYFCALGRGVAATGRLNPEGKAEAEAAMARFAALVQRLKVREIHGVATAAIRSASDGPAFIAEINRRHGFDIEVIDGTTEATLAAQGIQSAFYRPDGLVADLGGGSLELARLCEGEISQQQSLGFGSLALDGVAADAKSIRSLIKDHRSLPIPRADTLYAIGGSFRNLAKHHVVAREYPLGLIHGYRISLRQLSALIRRLEPLSPDEIAALPGVSAKRADSMLATGILLRELMRAADADQVVFSVSGIREGLAYRQLSERAQARDPLLASAYDLGMLAGRSGAYAEELYAWTQPLFADDTPERQRLRRALCTIGEIAWTIDPVYRAEWAWDRVIHSAIKGLTHHERLILALGLYHRYSSRWKHDDRLIRFVTDEQQQWAQRAGLAMNLAFQLSAGRAGNLNHFELAVKKGTLTLTHDKAAAPLMTSLVEKKLAALQEVVG